MKCQRETCYYKVHTKPQCSRTHCCKACKNTGKHGQACEKKRYKENRIMKALSVSSTTITNTSVYSWGDSMYGQYIIFNFTTSATAQKMTRINYEVLVAPSKTEAPVLSFSGYTPYLFNNSQIIFTNKTLLDKNIQLKLSLVFSDNSETAKKSSSIKLLSSSPYINCDYFNNPTTTKAPTTKAPTTNATTTTIGPDPVITLTAEESSYNLSWICNFSPVKTTYIIGSFGSFVTFGILGNVPINKVLTEANFGSHLFSGTDDSATVGMDDGAFPIAIVSYDGNNYIFSNIVEEPVGPDPG